MIAIMDVPLKEVAAIPVNGSSGHPVGAVRGAPARGRDVAPAGMRLTPDPGARLVADGSVLVGGSPVRVLRLTPAGSRQVRSWFSGVPVPPGAGARALARKLLDAGIAHPDFGGPDLEFPGVADVTVVIPVRGRHAELDRCLAGLRDLPRVIVVDDASEDPVAASPPRRDPYRGDPCRCAPRRHRAGRPHRSGTRHSHIYTDPEQPLVSPFSAISC